MIGIQLGFALDNGDLVIRTLKQSKNPNEPQKGHIELATEIIRDMKWEKEFARSGWGDRVDFLVYEKGALKIGTRFGDRVVSYYPPKLTKKTQGVLGDYQLRRYRVEEIQKPEGTESVTRYFHY